MKGLAQLIEARSCGFKHAHVVIQEGECDFDPHMPHWMQIEDRDVPGRMDLRVVIGCWVTVTGWDEGLVRRWATAALEAGASTVVAAAYHRVGLRTEQTSFEVLRLHGVDQCITT